MTDIDLGDLDLSKPYEEMLTEMEQAGAIDAEDVSIALQEVIQQNYRRFDQGRRGAQQQD